MTDLMDNFKEATHYVIDINDFDALIRKHLAPLTEDPKSYEEFESAAEFEWYENDHHTSVCKEDTTNEIYVKWNKHDIMTNCANFGFHYLMVFLLDHGLIKEGNYTVRY